MILNSIKILQKEIFHKFFGKFIYLIALIIIEGIILSSSVLSIIPIADFLIDPNLESPSKVTNYFIKLLEYFNLEINLIYLILLFIASNLLRSFFGIYIGFMILRIKYCLLWTGH